MPDRWITAPQALERLGVRPQTLYAYVSRGRVEARPDEADPRRSLYRAADVDDLADRKARGRRPADVARQSIAWGEPVLASAITTVVRGRLYYRGVDAAELSATATLEEAAQLLCAGADGPMPAPAEAADTPVPEGETAKARAFAALARLAGHDAAAMGRSTPALLGEAATILRTVATAMAGRPGRGPVHRRLARAWDCGPEASELIRRALVLIADHELNASTFACRVAASTGASLSASVLAGLSALSGPLHGAEFIRVQTFLDEAAARGPQAAVESRLAQGLRIAGFGHPLYPDGDVRAHALLAALTPDPAFEAAREAAETITGQIANIDFALTAFCRTHGLPDEAPFALFAAGRCAGWLAHAIEQGQTGALIRPRARYVGTAP